MLEYFWDRSAGLLLIDPPVQVDPPVRGEVELIVVEALIPGKGMTVLGYGYCPKDSESAPLFSVGLPEIEDESELRLTVSCFPSFSGDRPQPIVDYPRLVARPSDGRGECAIWAVVRKPSLLSYEIFGPEDQAPQDIISGLWSSRREGDIIYPAERSSESGAVQTIKVTTAFKKDEKGNVETPVQCKLTLSNLPSDFPQMERQIKVFTLSSSTVVQPFLSGEIQSIGEPANHTRVTLRPSGEDQIIYLPLLDEDNKDSNEGIAENHRPDLLTINIFPQLKQGDFSGK